MRLINTETLLLEEFTGDKSPRSYAILSYTWDEQEVSYQQFRRLSSDLRSTKSYQKIEACCRQARLDGLNHVWADTCFIDKTSSVELSEAINSMFRWYANARTCFAYLPDVDLKTQNVRKLDSQLTTSRWFSRGWTLQELIAPKSVVFYDKAWTRIGTKNSVVDTITRTTGIDRCCLLHQEALSYFSIACRMSWAAAQQTTRTEDIAYCLLGIFDVNMPLIYGEGTKSFRRLQEEIIKGSDDQSIFAWQTFWRSNCKSETSAITGILAENPYEFKHSANIRPIDMLSVPYSISNRGISIVLPVSTTNDGNKVALLACCDQRFYHDGKRVGISIRDTKRPDVFARRAGTGLGLVSETTLFSTRAEPIYLLK